MTFIAFLRAEIGLQLRQRQDWLLLLLFFVLVLVLLPFAVGAEPDLLRRIAPGLIWLAVILVNLLAAERLFVADAREGLLDQWHFSRLPLVGIVAVKLVAQILLLLTVLLGLLPLLWILFDLSLATLKIMALTFLLGVPLLQLLGGVLAALTLGVRRGLGLMTVLLFPLTIPVLIFAVSAVDAVMLGVSPRAALFFMGAMLALFAPLAPLLIATALRET